MDRRSFGGAMQVGTLVKTLPTAGKQLIGVVIKTGTVSRSYKVLWNNNAWGWYKKENIVVVKCK